MLLKEFVINLSLINSFESVCVHEGRVEPDAGGGGDGLAGQEEQAPGQHHHQVHRVPYYLARSDVITCMES